MGDEKARRIDDALSSLVSALIPTLPDEDEAFVEARHDEGLELARRILEKFVFCALSLCSMLISREYRHENSSGASDVNHVSDLIKQKRRLIPRDPKLK